MARRVAPSGSLDALLAAKEIVVTCGSGGVGKTTTAAAAAAMAAAHHGGRVLVLTVDPARRLANALGLEAFGNVERRVDDAAFEAAGVVPRGELWVAMLDTKQSWDDLVRRHAPDAATRDAILANPLYENITTRFVSSHDYIAMERLFDIHGTGAYDLLVVDTPPSRNAARLPRCAEADGRVLQQPVAPLAHGPLPLAGDDRSLSALLPAGRSHPRLAVPAGHRRVLHPLPDDARRLRRSREIGAAPARGQPHDLRGGHDARTVAVARGRVLRGRAPRPQAQPRRGRHEQGVARLPPRPRGGANRDRDVGDSGDVGQDARTRGVGRPDAMSLASSRMWRRASTTTRWPRAAKPSSARACRPLPTRSSPCRSSAPISPTWRASSSSGATCGVGGGGIALRGESTTVRAQSSESGYHGAHGCSGRRNAAPE